jgi:hypothetical protein
MAVLEYFLERLGPLHHVRGQHVVVPDIIPCWWLIGTELAVCSNPRCVRSHRAATTVAP